MMQRVSEWHLSRVSSCLPGPGGHGSLFSLRTPPDLSLPLLQRASATGQTSSQKNVSDPASLGHHNKIKQMQQKS